MTQYDSEVEYQRRKIAAEEWGNQIKYIMAQNGYMEIGYNNNRVTREYHRGKDKGSFEVIEEAWSLKELMLQYTG